MIEILPMRPGGPSLEPVWRDYRRRYALSEDAVLNTLVEALATRRAQALVAVQGGRPVGAVILGRQGRQGQIYALHALAEAPQAEALLLARAEEELARTEKLERISATLAVLPGGTLEDTFRRHGYRVIPRARLVLDLASLERPPAWPAGYRLVPWQEGRLDEAAALVQTAHHDSEDVFLAPEITEPAGARRLMERSMAGDFGPFDPNLAWMALAADELAGLCLNVWHGALAGQGFILDLSVAVGHRRRGVGRALVTASAQSFRRAGAGTLGLAVTLTNLPALRLYESLGFRVEQHFDLFQKECPS